MRCEVACNDSIHVTIDLNFVVSGTSIIRRIMLHLEKGLELQYNWITFCIKHFNVQIRIPHSNSYSKVSEHNNYSET